jgi:hypothetical protein
MPGHKFRWVGVVCRSGPDHYHRRFAPVKSELGRHVFHLGHASSWTAESRPHCRLDGPHCPMQLGSQPIGFTSTRSSDRKSGTRHSQFQIIQISIALYSISNVRFTGLLATRCRAVGLICVSFPSTHVLSAIVNGHKLGRTGKALLSRRPLWAVLGGVGRHKRSGKCVNVRCRTGF